jgi:hypothetical protein
MNLTNCPICGIVVNQDALNFPDEEGYDKEENRFPSHSYVYINSKFRPYLPCPIPSCHGRIVHTTKKD